MKERGRIQERLITTTVLLMGLTAVAAAGKWAWEETATYAVKAWEVASDFVDESDPSDDLYYGTTTRIGHAATECFREADGRGFSQIVPAGNDNERRIAFPREGNETIVDDPEKVEACVAEHMAGYRVTLVPITPEPL